METPIEEVVKANCRKCVENYKQKLKDFEILTYVKLINNVKSQYDKNSEKEKEYILNVVLNGNKELYNIATN